jgi:hypothetical protein
VGLEEDALRAAAERRARDDRRQQQRHAAEARAVSAEETAMLDAANKAVHAWAAKLRYPMKAIQFRYIPGHDERRGSCVHRLWSRS